ncbi:MAG: hypothetical protein LBD86_01945 [Spirochaetaceae bacterium]|jgi:uncharacterized lipoprotein YmbA|nr:hypothetical protein [Spirochaetaceae bacterium]
MFSQELLNVLKHILSSWQVIAMAVVILIYWSLVSYVTNFSGKPVSKVSVAKRKKIKRPPPGPQLDKNIDASGIGIGE